MSCKPAFSLSLNCLPAPQDGTDVFLIPAVDMINHASNPERRNSNLCRWVRAFRCTLSCHCHFRSQHRHRQICLFSRWFLLPVGHRDLLSTLLMFAPVQAEHCQKRRACGWRRSQFLWLLSDASRQGHRSRRTGVLALLFTLAFSRHCLCGISTHFYLMAICFSHTQVLHTYGDLSDSALLQTYGFVDEDAGESGGSAQGGEPSAAWVNPHNHVLVPFSAVQQCTHSMLTEAMEVG